LDFPSGKRLLFPDFLFLYIFFDKKYMFFMKQLTDVGAEVGLK